MAFNTFNLSNSALSEFDTDTLTNIYPAGTLLVGEDGTAYRARQAYADMDDTVVQYFSELDLYGANGVVRDLPEDVRVVWFPNE